MKENHDIVSIIKSEHEFKPDSSRVITRYFYPGGNKERALRIINRVLSLSAETVAEQLKEVLFLFSDRHRNIKKTFIDHSESILEQTKIGKNISEKRKLLIGAYFTMEYSVASAAYFNPSMIPHPDQSHLDEGDLRFIQSFRAVGEGHISSILFSEGIIRKNGKIDIEQKPPFLDQGEINHLNETVYELTFDNDSEICSRSIFPAVDNEKLGLEDVRFVKFENGKFYGTYTAYNGTEIFPKLIETEDFKNYKVSLLEGEGAQNKGMSLFPEKINGRYAMISRQDNENLFIMYSKDIYHWENPQLLKMPVESWEFIQIGNCGSPIKTEYGWLLLTHGVGAVRRYCMGALLLDYEDPSKVIGDLKVPFLWPDAEERNGYVPNVVYSCGGLIHNAKLIIPYAVSDTSSKIAIVDADELIGKMIRI